MFAGSVVVDVDRELFVEAGDTGTMKVGTFDDEDRIVSLIDPFDVANIGRTGKASIREGNIATNNDLSRFSERTQKPAKAERRSDTISIGFDVSGDSKILLVFN
jgi:hypothetical protein